MHWTAREVSTDELRFGSRTIRPLIDLHAKRPVHPPSSLHPPPAVYLCTLSSKLCSFTKYTLRLLIQYKIEAHGDKMVLTTVYWNLASSDHSSSSTTSVRWPVTVIARSPCSSFSQSASELLRARSLSKWLSFVRDVGFYEDRHNLFQSLTDNKARMQQIEVHAIDARLRSWASEDHNHCLNTHDCYSVSCKPCVLRYLDEYASQASIDDLTDQTTKVKDVSRRPDSTDLGTSNSLSRNAITEGFRTLRQAVCDKYRQDTTQHLDREATRHIG
jgi:hypothetical protein